MPVRFVVPDGEACDNEGERWQEDCNTCRCDRGRVTCTKEPCVGLARGGEGEGWWWQEWGCVELNRGREIVKFKVSKDSNKTMLISAS